jgi:hypothetical protein
MCKPRFYLLSTLGAGRLGERPLASGRATVLADVRRLMKLTVYFSKKPRLYLFPMLGATGLPDVVRAVQLRFTTGSKPRRDSSGDMRAMRLFSRMSKAPCVSAKKSRFAHSVGMFDREARATRAFEGWRFSVYKFPSNFRGWTPVSQSARSVVPVFPGFGEFRTDRSASARLPHSRRPYSSPG